MAVGGKGVVCAAPFHGGDYHEPHSPWLNKTHSHTDVTPGLDTPNLRISGLPKAKGSPLPAPHGVPLIPSSNRSRHPRLVHVQAGWRQTVEMGPGPGSQVTGGSPSGSARSPMCWTSSHGPGISLLANLTPATPSGDRTEKQNI